MNKLRNTVGLVALCCASGALALPQGSYWVEVPVIDDAGDASDLTGFRSFDLFVVLEPGDMVFAQDFGVAGGNIGLSLGAGQDFFQHASGSDTESSPAAVGILPDLTYDTRGQMGTNAWDEFDTVGPIDWSTSGVSGAWFTTVPSPGMALPDAMGNYWFARITVNSAGLFGESTAGLGEFLGGELFMSGEGPNGDFGMEIETLPFGVVTVPNAFIPAPGSTAVLAILMSGAAIRRRR